MVVIGHCIEKKWTKQKVYTKLLTDGHTTHTTQTTQTTQTHEACSQKVHPTDDLKMGWVLNI